MSFISLGRSARNRFELARCAAENGLVGHARAKAAPRIDGELATLRKKMRPVKPNLNTREGYQQYLKAQAAALQKHVQEHPELLKDLAQPLKPEPQFQTFCT